MGRLIDADKLKADLEKAISKNEDMDCLDFLRVASVIDAQPTAFFKQAIMMIVDAYDPDKVVEQLEDYLFEKYCVEGDSEIERIVKGGGVDAKTDS